MKKNLARKFKYGSASVAFTVAFIAIVVALNAVFTALSARYTLYLDMTASNYYDISSATDDLLADVTDEITFIFCTPLDKLADNRYSAMIYTLAQAYAARFDNISIDYLNWRTETERTRGYMITSGTVIDDQTVIVDCPARSQYRLLRWESFITNDSDGNAYGFSGELRFSSAILQITGDNPTVAFTTNHSEDIEEAKALMELFETAGYQVKTFDLTAESIPEDASIVVVFRPRTDFLGIGAKENEFEKLDAFSADLGHLMVFLSASVPDLPELYSYLYENWYVGVDPVTVTDTAENALSADGRILSATYSTLDTPGASLTTTLRSMQSTPRAIMENALALSIAPGGDNPEGDVVTSYVLTTSDEAGIYRNGQADGTGTYGLMTLSSRGTYVGNDYLVNYVLVSASADFAGADYLNSLSCSNSDILYSAMMAMGKDKVPDQIDIRKFEDSSLTITTAQANNWTMVFAVVLPLLFLCAGFVVYFRRRHL